MGRWVNFTATDSANAQYRRLKCVSIEMLVGNRSSTTMDVVQTFHNVKLLWCLHFVHLPSCATGHNWVTKDRRRRTKYVVIISNHAPTSVNLFRPTIHVILSTIDNFTNNVIFTLSLLYLYILGLENGRTESNS